ncbi:MAG: hypothetical protein OEM05_15735 [Myxococcales bacterium]|nr:hypothetical protein [Myxococcales bacterium]
MREPRSRDSRPFDATIRLVEVPPSGGRAPLSQRGVELVREGLARSRDIACFDFVPSDYAVVYGELAALPRGSFCEWGSGIGIATGLAELLGFEAHGIEIDAAMAAASRRLLADFGLSATVETGDYLAIEHASDVYFTYCWPGQMLRVERRFLESAPESARLLICHGAGDVRCKVKQNEGLGPVVLGAT